MLGAIRFIDVDEMDVMTIREHSMCTDVEWDPTGRYFAVDLVDVPLDANDCGMRVVMRQCFTLRKIDG